MLDTRRTRPVVTTVMTAFDATGTAVPDEVADAFARYRTVQQAFTDRPRPSHEDLAGAVIAAIEAGRAPEDDDDVQRLLIVQDLAARAGLADVVDALLLAALRTAVGDGDTVIDAWQPAFDRAATAIADALDQLGPIDLTNTDAVVRKGTAATEAWQAATEAVRTINTLDRGWTSLHAYVGSGAYPQKPYALLRITAPSADQWLDQHLAGRPPDPWAATLDGLELTLPTITEYRQRIENIAHAAENRFADAERAEQARRHPAIVPG